MYSGDEETEGRVVRSAEECIQSGVLERVGVAMCKELATVTSQGALCSCFRLVSGMGDAQTQVRWIMDDATTRLAEAMGFSLQVYKLLLGVMAFQVILLTSCITWAVLRYTHAHFGFTLYPSCPTTAPEERTHHGSGTDMLDGGHADVGIHFRPRRSRSSQTPPPRHHKRKSRGFGMGLLVLEAENMSLLDSNSLYDTDEKATFKNATGNFILDNTTGNTLLKKVDMDGLGSGKNMELTRTTSQGYWHGVGRRLVD